VTKKVWELLVLCIYNLVNLLCHFLVFDDGDITSLKRTALCLKSGKHFAASSTLDQLPLTHPEHIRSPVRTNIVQSCRIRKPKKSVE
jgi:Ras-related protein Rab-1A